MPSATSADGTTNEKLQRPANAHHAFDGTCEAPAASGCLRLYARGGTVGTNNICGPPLPPEARVSPPMPSTTRLQKSTKNRLDDFSRIALQVKQNSKSEKNVKERFFSPISSDLTCRASLYIQNWCAGLSDPCIYASQTVASGRMHDARHPLMPR